LPIRRRLTRPISHLQAKPRERGEQRLREDTTMDIFKTIAPYLRARFGTTERGAALVEYALLLALIAVVCIVALTTLGGKASSKFDTIGNSLG
jgi:pilus assembly protein Flp/PilA